MILHPLTRHLAVCSLSEVQRFLDLNRDFWHVISIRDTTCPKLTLRNSLDVLPQFFDDVEVAGTATESRGITGSQAAAIWSFVDLTKAGALLIHCVAGLSRSTSVAAAIFARALAESGTPANEIATGVVERLLAVRPPACPNSLVLLRLLEQVMVPNLALQITELVRDDDRILHNRFVRPR